MKKLIAAVLVMGMAVSMTACGDDKADNKEASGAESEQNSETGAVEGEESGNTFTVGFDQDFPPFGYVGDDGEFTGFDIEMATECAKRMGKEIKLQPIDWDAKDMELERSSLLSETALHSFSHSAKHHFTLSFRVTQLCVMLCFL